MGMGNLFGIGCCNCTIPTGTQQPVSMPDCFCSTPYTLQMTSLAPDCNYRMFQSCTIQYGPPPPAMQQLYFTANVYTSTQQFLDPVTQSKFFYYFWCHYNQFFLTRIFPTSPFGSPYRDAILYTWVIGGYGNTCNPFSLQSGTPYPGSDANCAVTMTGASTQTPPVAGPSTSNPPNAS